MVYLFFLLYFDTEKSLTSEFALSVLIVNLGQWKIFRHHN